MRDPIWRGHRSAVNFDAGGEPSGRPYCQGEDVSKLRLRISISLDSFVAGPSQSVDNPLGIGGRGCTSGLLHLRSRARNTDSKVAKSTKAPRSSRSRLPASEPW